MTQVYFNGHDASGPVSASFACTTSSLLILWSPATATFSLASFSFLSLSLGVERDSRDLPKSNAVPGVFGVFVAEPKEAKAPEPKPKADDAVEFGDATLEVLKGAIVLNALPRPWEELSPPKRFELEKLRDGREPSPLPCSRSDVVRDNLLLLAPMLACPNPHIFARSQLGVLGAASP